MENLFFAETSPLHSLGGEESNDITFERFENRSDNNFIFGKSAPQNITGALPPHVHPTDNSLRGSRSQNNDEIYFLLIDQLIPPTRSTFDIQPKASVDTIHDPTRYFHNFLQTYVLNMEEIDKERINKMITTAIHSQVPKPNIWNGRFRPGATMFEYLRLPISQIFHLNTFQNIPPPEPFVCSCYPHCRFTSSSYQDIRHHMITEHSINSDDDILIHENIIQNLLTFHSHITKEANYKRLCPFPNCRYVVNNNFELINHINTDHALPMILNSLKTVGLFWTLIFTWTKIYGQLPTILNLLKIQVDLNITYHINTNAKCEILLIDEHYDFVKSNNFETPLWILVIEQENINFEIPNIFPYKGIIIPPNTYRIENKKIDIEPQTMQKLLEKIKIIKIEQSSPEVIRFKTPEIEHVKEIIKVPDFERVKERIPIPQFIKEDYKVNVPDFDIIPQNCPIPVPHYVEEERIIKVPDIKYKEENMIVPIPIPEYRKDLKVVDVPDFKYNKENVVVPLPDYRKEDFPVAIPVPDYREDRKVVDLPSFKYKEKEKEVEVPKFNYVEKDVDVPLPRITLNINIGSINTSNENNNNNNNSTQNDNTQVRTNIITQGFNNNIQENQNGNNENNQNNQNNNLNNNTQQEDLTPENLINDIKNANNKYEIKQVINKWKDKELNETLFMCNTDRLKIPILNIIAYEKRWPGVGQFACTQGDGCAFDNTLHLKQHETKVHGKTFPGCTMLEFLNFLSLRDNYWEQIDTQGQHQCYHKNLYFCFCPKCTYFTMNQGSLASHLKTKHRYIFDEKVNLGWIWATIKEWINKENRSLTIKELMK